MREARRPWSGWWAARSSPADGSPGEAHGAVSAPRILLVGFVVLAGLGVALATGALRAGKLEPPAPVTVPTLGRIVNGTFTGSGITFDYPKSWHDVASPRGTPAGDWRPVGRIVIGPGAGSDRVTVEAFRLSVQVTPENETGLMALLAQKVSLFARAQHGSVETSMSNGTLGTLRAFTAKATWPGPGGITVQGRFYYGYEGFAIYSVDCRIASDAPAQVGAGCSRIVKTFRIG